MDDKQAELPLGLEKSLPEPEQVCWLLFFERHPRSDAGMNRQVTSQPNPGARLLVELAMFMRDHLAKLAPNDDPGGQAGRRPQCQTIGQHGGIPANRYPLIKAILAVEEVQQQLLVIAAQEHGMNRPGPVDQPAHHARRIWAAIDIVAQIDLHGASAVKPSLVLVDTPLHVQQQIEPPVNVANNIYGEAVRRWWIPHWRGLQL